MSTHDEIFGTEVSCDWDLYRFLHTKSIFLTLVFAKIVKFIDAHEENQCEDFIFVFTYVQFFIVNFRNNP